MKKTFFPNKISKWLLLTGMVLALTINGVSAAGRSIGVRPLKNDILIKPGETQTKKITIVNNTKEEVTAVPILEVFNKSDAAGYPDEFKTGDKSNPQDITNWIEINKDPVKVAPFTTKEVEYKIKAPQNAEPGGHYGALLFEPYDPSPSSGIKIQVRVASLLLVRVDGPAKEGAEITNFNLNSTKIFDDKPLVFDVEVKNTGNVHFVPEGRIVLKNSKGEVLKKVGKWIDSDGQAKIYDFVPVNYKRGHILPQSSRLFDDAIWEKPIFNEEITADLGLAYSDIAEPLHKTIKFTLTRNLEVKEFDFSLMERKFTLILKNNGTVLISPKGAIKIYNAFDFQVDEIPLAPKEDKKTTQTGSKTETSGTGANAAVTESDAPLAGEDYLKQGEERTYLFTWNKEVPSGRYKAVYEYEGELDNLKSEPITFVIGNPILAILLSAQGIIAIVMLVVVIAGVIILKKRKAKDQNSVQPQVQQPFSSQSQPQQPTQAEPQSADIAPKTTEQK